MLTTTASYDVFGRVVSMTSPGAQSGARTTAHQYDLNDNQEWVQAPNGAKTFNAFRPDDQVKTTTLPSNGSPDTRMVVFEYDALGRLCREIAPEAGATSAECPATDVEVPPEYATDYRYDPVGQLKSVTGRDHEGKSVVTSYEYDEVGNVEHVRDPKLNRSNPSGYTSEAAYDRNHRQVSLTDALGNTVRTAYNADGQVVRTIDQAGKPTRYAYDRAGRLETTTVTYNPPGKDPEEWTSRNEYDKAGNLVRVYRPRTIAHGSETTELFTETKYDENNRPFRTLSAYDTQDASARYQLPTSTFLRYDAFGRLAAQSVPVQVPVASDVPPTAADQWSTFTHFDSGEIASSTDPTGLKTTYGYDRIGKQSARTLIGGSKNRTMTWAYHDDGSLASRTDAGAPSAALVVDNPATAAGWSQVTPSGGGGYGAGYLAHAPGGTDAATWDVTPSDAGQYKVQFSCPKPAAAEPAGGRAASVSYTLTSGQTTTTLTGDQTGCDAQQWRDLDQTVELSPSARATLSVSPSAGGVVVADAVRLVPVNPQRGFSYTYDRNGQQTSVTNTGVGVRASSWATAYDVLGRPKTVQELSGSTVLRQTSYSWDANSNPLSESPRV